MLWSLPREEVRFRDFEFLFSFDLAFLRRFLVPWRDLLDDLLELSLTLLELSGCGFVTISGPGKFLETNVS